MATNFGDELSKHVVEAATRRRVVWSAPGSADLVGVGSVLGLYASLGSGAAIWGSGIREHLDPLESKRLHDRLGPVLAVRGQLTRNALGLSDSQVLGDPGVLAPLFARPSPKVDRRPLVIPHFRAWASVGGRDTLASLRAAGFDIAEPTLHPKSMINRITDSSLVLTSSLHGLILGHSLGRPTQLVSWDSHGQSEPDFKYADYFSSIGEVSSKIPISAVLSEPSLRAAWDRADAKTPELAAKTSKLAEDLMRVAETL
ncbi:polysaccharide pyruvyl transferase family protein [Pseudarthrobacter equi]|uniref:polysaccharide pyruvyl transferase family protein n=1 Tax=Pseudarthrobacter equi TaxID=728066 RepID=UPI00389A69B2